MFIYSIISNQVKFTLNWTHVYVYIQLRVNLTRVEIIGIKFHKYFPYTTLTINVFQYSQVK